MGPLSGDVHDNGNDINEDDCLNTCVFAICGDQVIAMSEQCDDGNLENNDSCTNSCALNVCGDGVSNEGIEECDDGNLIDGDGCNSVCLAEVCGNGVLDPGEVCDDGNGSDHDDCSSKCTATFCGDGVVHDGVEQCDDGNMVETDQCTSGCIQGPCGDGIYNLQTEQCDFSAVPFKDHPGLCSDACTLDFCFKLTNTADADFKDVEWFKPCVDAVGARVHIVVINPQKQVSYIATGNKADWTYDSITSDSAPNLQYQLASHVPIKLDNGDRLHIAGTSSVPPMESCPQSVGDGYGLVVLPPVGDGLKLLLMPYKGKSGGVRLFKNWSTSHELSFNPQGMGLCLDPGLTAAVGSTVLISVTP